MDVPQISTLLTILTSVCPDYSSYSMQAGLYDIGIEDHNVMLILAMFHAHALLAQMLPHAFCMMLPSVNHQWLSIDAETYMAYIVNVMEL
ncbi:hypothetical protein [Ralstonia solanacearum]|uniref:hypothetical protein n=1 Tax=Ralstonia solanacearum TaxID=305 RepID=UPI000A11F918|nr:hypothetical protein [Ralstonia solanacearum]